MRGAIGKRGLFRVLVAAGLECGGVGEALLSEQCGVFDVAVGDETVRLAWREDLISLRTGAACKGCSAST